MVADLLHAGNSRKEILQEMNNNCKTSQKTIDNWIKCARPIVLERQQQDEEVRRRESDAIVTDAVKRHGVTKERVIERLAKIAFGDISKLFTVDGGLKPISEWDDEIKGIIAGVESMDVSNPESGEKLGTNRKIKILSPIEALQELNKMLGYYVPTKQDVTITKVGKELADETYV